MGLIDGCEIEVTNVANVPMFYFLLSFYKEKGKNTNKKQEEDFVFFDFMACENVKITTQLLKKTKKVAFISSQHMQKYSNKSKSNHFKKHCARYTTHFTQSALAGCINSLLQLIFHKRLQYQVQMHSLPDE